MSVAGIAAQLTCTIGGRGRLSSMDIGREQLLAAAGLAEQQDRRIGGCDLLELLQDPTHRLDA